VLTVDVDETGVECNAADTTETEDDGSIYANVTGGVPPYSYLNKKKKKKKDFKKILIFYK
jgi:hypothetical protein